ncbi:copper resistance protein B [Gilvimarinus sp. DA14]|nr:MULTISPECIES: copper resistance protein B [Gilvimarinus]UTF61243.1 copper resistance protein B [Gilvimarinus sp. DA14]
MSMNYFTRLTHISLVLASVLASGAYAEMDHSNHDSGAHEMGQAQGGKAPDNARDPHAYSDGFTLTEGPYALPGPRQLRLADEHRFWAIIGDRLEYQEKSESTVFDLQAWYGTTYNRFVVKTEGDSVDGALEESSTDVFWSRAFNAYFDAQLGARVDTYDEGENRQWLALGFQGLAPYWFELDVTAYLGDDGRSALSAEAEYELLFTQRLILQPRIEINLLGKDDPENGLGSGLTNLSAGLRLRYEFSRQFAPYIGVEWSRAFDDTADYLLAAGEDKSSSQLVAGLKFWF